jgi:hypothetical protein
VTKASATACADRKKCGEGGDWVREGALFWNLCAVEWSDAPSSTGRTPPPKYRAQGATPTWRTWGARARREEKEKVNLAFSAEAKTLARPLPRAAPTHSHRAHTDSPPQPLRRAPTMNRAARAVSRHLGGATTTSAALTSCRVVAPSFAASAPRRAYHQNIIDHYENPRNVGACGPRRTGAAAATATGFGTPPRSDSPFCVLSLFAAQVPSTRRPRRSARALWARRRAVT